MMTRFGLVLAVGWASGAVGCGGEAGPMPVAQADAITAEAVTAAAVTAAPSCAPVVLVTGQDSPFAIAADGERVYWANVVPGTIASVSRFGGPVFEVARGQHLPEAIAVDAASVYWANVGSGDPGYADGSIVAASKLGGRPRVLASNRHFPQTIAVDGGEVFWSEEGSVDAVAACGGVPRLVAATVSIAAIAVGGRDVFFSDVDQEEPIFRSPKWGGLARAITPAQKVSSMALRDGRIFFRSAEDQIRSVGIAGGTPVVVGQTPRTASYASSIAVDDRYVYFMTDTQVLRLAKSGGTAEVIAAGQPFPGGIAVDEHGVYWTAFDGTSGIVATVPKRCRRM